jgi:hypothetical protein
MIVNAAVNRSNSDARWTLDANDVDIDESSTSPTAEVLAWLDSVEHPIRRTLIGQLALAPAGLDAWRLGTANRLEAKPTMTTSEITETLSEAETVGVCTKFADRRLGDWWVCQPLWKEFFASRIDAGQRSQIAQTLADAVADASYTTGLPPSTRTTVPCGSTRLSTGDGVFRDGYGAALGGLV